jgi:hypothetical protein
MDIGVLIVSFIVLISFVGMGSIIMSMILEKDNIESVKKYNNQEENWVIIEEKLLQ